MYAITKWCKMFNIINILKEDIGTNSKAFYNLQLANTTKTLEKLLIKNHKPRSKGLLIVAVNSHGRKESFICQPCQIMFAIFGIRIFPKSLYCKQKI